MQLCTLETPLVHTCACAAADCSSRCPPAPFRLSSYRSNSLLSKSDYMLEATELARPSRGDMPDETRSRTRMTNRNLVESRIATKSSKFKKVTQQNIYAAALGVGSAT